MTEQDYRYESELQSQKIARLRERVAEFVSVLDEVSQGSVPILADLLARAQRKGAADAIAQFEAGEEERLARAKAEGAAEALEQWAIERERAARMEAALTHARQILRSLGYWGEAQIIADVLADSAGALAAHDREIGADEIAKEGK